MTLWPTRIAVICGMGATIALWIWAAPFYLGACYDFDGFCSHQWLKRLLFFAAPPVMGAITAVLILRLIERKRS